MQWTAYLTECLRVLEEEKEFESDALLVQLVKLRRISESVNSLSWSSTITEPDITIKAPATFYLRTLESQLQDFRNNIPSELATNRKLFLLSFDLESPYVALDYIYRSRL
jgi:hypothetical protein